MEKTIKLQTFGVKITAIKLSMRCVDCGHTWGVFLDEHGQLPSTGDKCLECSKKKSEAVRQAFETLNT
jgi:hypothetical protein